MNFIERQSIAAMVVFGNFRNVLRFRNRMGHWPRILFPRTYNEKVFWRKLFDHNPDIARLTDKLKAKTYFSEMCPDIHVTDPLWVGTRAQDMPDDLLTQDVIIKTNHGSAYNIIMRDTKLDRATINKTVNEWLGTVYAKGSLEWAYGQIEPKVYIEPMLRPQTDQLPYDFNFEVCGGQITSCFVMGDKASGHAKIGIFDAQGDRLSVRVKSVPDPEDQLPQDTVLPSAYLKAADYARRLGAPFDNVRVDFMCVDNMIYGCEMTFYSLSGRGNQFSDPDMYRTLSNAWDLRKSWFLQTDHEGWRGRYAAGLMAKLNNSPTPYTGEAPQW